MRGRNFWKSARFCQFRSRFPRPRSNRECAGRARRRGAGGAGSNKGGAAARALGGMVRERGLGGESGRSSRLLPGFRREAETTFRRAGRRMRTAGGRIARCGRAGAGANPYISRKVMDKNVAIFPTFLSMASPVRNAPGKAAGQKPAGFRALSPPPAQSRKSRKIDTFLSTIFWKRNPASIRRVAAPVTTPRAYTPRAPAGRTRPCHRRLAQVPCVCPRAADAPPTCGRAAERRVGDAGFAGAQERARAFRPAGEMAGPPHIRIPHWHKSGFLHGFPDAAIDPRGETAGQSFGRFRLAASDALATNENCPTSALSARIS